MVCAWVYLKKDVRSCVFLSFVLPWCVVCFVCAVLDDGLLIVLVCVVTLLLPVFLYMFFYLCALCA